MALGLAIRRAMFLVRFGCLKYIPQSVDLEKKGGRFKPQRLQRHPTAHGSFEPDAVVYLDTSPRSPPSYTGLEEKHTVL